MTWTASAELPAALSATRDGTYSPRSKRQRLTSGGGERTPADTGTGSARAHSQHKTGSQEDTLVHAVPLAELEELRARAQRAEAELAAARDAWAAKAARLTSEACAVLSSELRRVEQEAAADRASLRDELASAASEHQSQVERLTHCASEARQECQRAIQDKLAESEGRQEAEKKARDLEAALVTERAKSSSANERVQRMLAEEGALRTSVARISNELHQLASGAN